MRQQNAKKTELEGLKRGLKCTNVYLLSKSLWFSSDLFVCHVGVKKDDTSGQVNFLLLAVNSHVVQKMNYSISKSFKELRNMFLSLLSTRTQWN